MGIVTTFLSIYFSFIGHLLIDAVVNLLHYAAITSPARLEVATLIGRLIDF